MVHNKTAEDLRIELKSLSKTLEEVIKNSGDKSDVELEKIRGKIEAVLQETRMKLGTVSDKVVMQTKEMARHVDDYVHDKPWTSIGISAAVAVVLGVLLAKR
ncbi:DUF883 family protein [Photorhabdus tasmaniensis]|uniref:DUF883 family protein n=1 Tax=Photorhabdus tasmaniensis TaxID=1004159 RepID=UPI004041FB30